MSRLKGVKTQKIVTTPSGILLGRIRIGAAPHGHIGNLRDVTAVKVS